MIPQQEILLLAMKAGQIQLENGAEICQRFASVNYVEMIAAITATSFAAAISPLSTGGAIIMSSYSSARETTTGEMNKMFYTLFLLSVGNVCVNVLMSALGVFSLGDYSKIQVERP